MGVYYGLENTSYFRGIAQKTTYVANYINQCVTQTKKEDFIYVGSNSSNNSAGAYQYTFNSEADLNSDWVRAESQNQGEIGISHNKNKVVGNGLVELLLMVVHVL